MVLEHIVLFKFSPDISESTLAKVADAAHDCGSATDDIIDVTFGAAPKEALHEGYRFRAQGFTHALHARFRSAEGLATYTPHEKHKQLVALVKASLDGQAEGPKLLAIDYFDNTLDDQGEAKSEAKPFDGDGVLTLGSPEPQHVVDIFLDLLCPMSKRAFPKAKAVAGIEGVQVRFWLYVQPWGPQSTYLTFYVNAASLLGGSDIALKLVEEIYRRGTSVPGSEWPNDEYSPGGSQWSTDRFMNTPPKAFCSEISSLAVEVTGLEAGELDRVVGEQSKKGPTLFKNSQKWARFQKIHVTPTVLIDGKEHSAVASGWPTEKWVEYVSSNM